MIDMSSCIDHGKHGGAQGYTTTWQPNRGKSVRTHRLVYCQHKDISLEDIEGQVVRHTCDNPRCINPEHLLLGTQQDNMDDKVSRDRQSKGAAHGLTSLTNDDVNYIREHCIPYSKVVGVLAMARKFKVTSAAISRILHGETWQHLGGV